MNWAGLASIALGIVVMYVAMMFITRDVEKNSSAGNFAAFVAILLSGTVVEFLTSKIGSNKTNFAQYAVGLGVGFVFYLVAYWIKHGGPPTLASLGWRRAG